MRGVIVSAEHGIIELNSTNTQNLQHYQKQASTKVPFLQAKKVHYSR
jgi:hypothetical protein